MRTLPVIIFAQILQRVAFLTLLLFFCTSHSLPAQVLSQYLPTQQLLFERLSYEQGLSESNVTAILQDKRGFLWIGTTNGLNRFDGYTFTIFRNKPNDSTTLANNTITALYEDHSGTLWVGTQNGLCAYDRKKGTFTTFVNTPNNPNTFPAGIPTSISNNTIRAISEDVEGNLWIGTKRGLNKLDVYREQFTVFKADKRKTDTSGRGKGPTDNEIIALHTLPSTPHILWIGARTGGINALDLRTMKFAAYPIEDSESTDVDINNNGIAAMTPDRNGNLWIGTRTEGVFLFNTSSHDCTRFINEDAYMTSAQEVLPIGTPTNRTSAIHSLQVDAQDNLWIGTRTGLWMLDNTRQHWTLHTNNSIDLNSLSDNDVNVIFQDRTGVLWFGTQNGGLSKFAPQSARFQVFKHNPVQWSGLHNGVVTAFAENIRKRGEVWVGTQNGLHTMLPSGEIRAVDELGGALQGMQILSLLQSRTGTLWIGTERGLIRAQANGTEGNNTSINTKQANTKQTRNDRRWTTTTYKNQNNENSLSDDVISALAEDTRGNIWVGTQGGGVNVLNPATNTITRYLADPEDLRSLSDNFVFSLLCDDKGTMWIGTSNGLCRFESSTQDFKVFQRQMKRDGSKNTMTNSTFPNTPILAIHQHAGALWLGTLGGGLYRFTPTSGAITRFGKDEELPSETIYGILHDSKKQLWLSTPRGLAIISLTGKPASTSQNTTHTDTTLRISVQSYNASDGLHSNTFRQGAALLVSSKVMMFGVGMGVVRFHPDSLQKNSIPPTIGFVRFRIFSSTELTSTIDIGDTISIDHSDNFEIEYAALDFTNIAKNRYAYIFEGVTKEWTYQDLVRTVTGTNFDPGTYKFRVKAANSDGLWNEEGATLTIIVRPPWWETWWFRTIAALAVIGAVVSGYKLRVRQINVQNERLVRLVEQRTFTLKEQSRLLEAQATEIQLANGALNEKNMELEQILDESEMARTELQRAYTLLDEENARKTQELEEARTFQLSMLPTEKPSVTDLDIAFAMRTATEVGGDYYDYVLAPDGTLTMAIGDATGHGVRAGMLVSLVKSSFHALSGESDLGVIVGTISQTIKQMNLQRMFMCLTLIRFRKGFDELSKKDFYTVEIAGAGMPPILHYSARTGTIHYHRPHGIALGVIHKAQYPTQTITLEAGDILLLTSDGLMELFNNEQEELGLVRIQKHFEQCFASATSDSGTQSSQNIITSLDTLADAWRGAVPQADDIAYLIIRAVL